MIATTITTGFCGFAGVASGLCAITGVGSIRGLAFVASEGVLAFAFSLAFGRGAGLSGNYFVHF
jgi:hypothetical protein